MERIFTITYIGLPDCQYRDVSVVAPNEEKARDAADAQLLKEYGMDNFDCLLIVENVTLN